MCVCVCVSIILANDLAKCYVAHHIAREENQFVFLSFFPQVSLRLRTSFSDLFSMSLRTA